MSLSVISFTVTQIILTVSIVSLIAGFCLCFIVWLRFSDLRKIYQQKKIFIEITPPLSAHKTPVSMEQLFHVLHSAGMAKRFRHKLLRRSIVFSLEVISSRHDGVRYVICADEQRADTIERNIMAFLSNARIKRISDPLLAENEYTQVKEFKQTKHFALPIRTYETFEEHDPIAYIAGAMNRLADGEQVAVQLVISPAKVRNMGTIVQRYREYYRVSEATHNKAYGQLFKVELRVRVVTTSSNILKERIQGIESAITAFTIPKVQTLKARYNFPEGIKGKRREWAFVHRMPSLNPKYSNIFSSLELANIYHFPADRTGTENIVKSLSRTLPAPLSLRRGDNTFSVILGETNHHGEKFKIGLTREERSRHALYIGKTGSGKTTMLEYEILQDIQNGEGVVFIDPHGDAAESLLGKIPEERIKDVVYFNPDDIDYPIAINLLEIPKDITGTELLRYKDRVTETIVTVFRKVFSEGGEGGSRLESTLRNALQTVLTLDDPTLATVYSLIQNPTFRYKVVRGLDDERLRDYWIHEVGEAGGMQRVKMMQGITTKLSRFLSSPAAERVLNQPTSTIDFSEILDSRKVLICNLSKGRLGDDTSQFFGLIILAKLQIAALLRAHQEAKNRVPVYVYVDEFQNFATDSFVELLAEARKYGINMNMAQQTLSQERSQRMINTIIGNSGTIVLFQSVSMDDETLIGRLFRNFIEPTEILDLPAYNFYARLSAVTSQEPVSGQTIVPDEESDPVTRRRVIDSSRKLYTRNYVVKTAQDVAETARSKNVDIESFDEETSEDEGSEGMVSSADAL